MHEAMTQIFWRRVQEWVAVTGQQPTDIRPLLQAQRQAAQVKSLQAELSDQALQTQLALRSKLTPEHLACWIELRKDRRRHGMRSGHVFGPGAV